MESSHSVRLKVFEFTNKADFRGLGDTKNQLERAALSISNNVAEGFERGTTKDLINFLYFARGSAGESRSILRLCESVPRFANFKFDISNLITQATGISKQLHGWIDSLKDSKIKGVKYFNQRTKQQAAKSKEDEEFDRQMAAFRKELEQKLKQQEIDNASARAASAGE